MNNHRYKLKIQYVTTDDEMFDDEDAAFAHEEVILYSNIAFTLKTSVKVAKYLVDHDLVGNPKVDLMSVGFWKIKGPNRSPDYNDTDLFQDLDIVEGPLLKVIEYAMGLEGFSFGERSGTVKNISIARLA